MHTRTKIAAKTSETKRDNSISLTRKSDFSQPISSPIDDILFLQRTIGNQAVQRLFKSGVLQAKLTIGQPNDIYEQEADRVAEQVMRMPGNSGVRVQDVGVSKEDGSVQTKPAPISGCPECEEEDAVLNDSEGTIQPKLKTPPLVQRQGEQEEEEILQTKETSNQSPEVTPDIESNINALRGSGLPLPNSLRAYFEPRFGYDFSQVRVHTGADAAESARGINAMAFIVGRDIVFGEGQYRPETMEGKRLLAHELAHVVQQERIKTSLHMQPDERPSEGLPADELTRSIIAGEHPLKLSLYDSETYQSNFFKHQANMIAEAIEAVRMPTTCPKDRTKLKLNIGATGFMNGSILPDLKKAKKCTGRKVNEFHVIGHTHDGVRFSEAARYAEHVETGARVVFHGCSVLSYKEGLTKLLKAFGSEAEIFAHPITGEAGRPYEFRRVTLPEENERIKTELLPQVTVILPEFYIIKWAMEQKSDRLYGLLKRKKEEVQDDAKEAFVEVLKVRLKKDVEKWSDRKLEQAEKRAGLYNWEQEVIIEELANRITLRDSVQYWKTTLLEQTLKEPGWSMPERTIIKEELGKRQRLKKDVKRWSERKLELNLVTPIAWVREIIIEELHERRRKK